MYLNWFIFAVISLLIIHFGYKWIEGITNTPRKTRDLVQSQTNKYKEMLEQYILATETPPRFVEPPKEDELVQDLLVFSRNLDGV
jgi:hypothetical protein